MRRMVRQAARCAAILPAALFIFATIAILLPAQVGAAEPSAMLDGEVIAHSPTANQTESAPVVPRAPDQAPNLLTLGHLLILAVAIFMGWLFFALNWHRLARAPKRPLAFSAVAGVFMLLGMLLLAPMGAGLAASLAQIDTTQSMGLRETAILTIGRYAAEAVVVGVFALLIFRARRPQPDRRLRPFTAVLAGTGALLLFWPAVLAASWIVNLALYILHNWTPEPIAHQTLAELQGAQPTIWFCAMVVIVVLVAPVFEEVTYRGLLQELLGRLNLPRWAPIIGTSAIFSSMHLAAAQSNLAAISMLTAIFILSLGLGWAYEKTGRLTAPITMHILFNAGNLAVAMSMSPTTA